MLPKAANQRVPNERNRVPRNMPRMLLEQFLPRKSCSRMDTSGSKYRAFAEECDRLARQAKTDAHRRILQEMALVWRQLAKDAEEK